MKNHLCILTIAIFLTASYRLVPIPIGDTARAAFYAVFVFLVSNIRRDWHLSISFFKYVWPLFAIMFLTLVLDTLLSRTGTFLSVTWIKFLSTMLVAAAVFTLTFKEIHRLILISIGLLIAQLALINLMPSYFISTAQSLGIVDPFVTHGRALERVYYAYFNANSASYTIYYMMLAYFCLGRVLPRSWTISMCITIVMIFLFLLTGGRGVILLSVGFILTWLFSFRSTRAATYVGLLFFSFAVALPVYDAVAELILLREESNIARLSAQIEYIELILQNPIFGIGVEATRERVVVFGSKPSHNFFLEIIVMFGIPLGGALILYLLYAMIIRPRALSVRVVGLFAILVGIFNNSLLTNWGFFPLLFPVILLVESEVKIRSRAYEVTPPFQTSNVKTIRMSQ